MTISRRDFMQLLSLAAAGALLPRHAGAEAPALVRNGDPRDVLVVGAGLAGLVSALLLKQAGHRVTLVDPRLRPGGRVTTMREPFADGLHGELGPARIPESHARVRRWIEHFGLELERFDPAVGDRYDYVLGRKVRYPVDKPPGLDAYPWPFTAKELKLGAAGVGDQWFAPMVEKAGDLVAHDWPPSHLAPLDALSTREYTRSRGLSDAVDKYFGLGFDDPWGSHFSALWVLRLVALSPFDRPLSRIRGGLDRLPYAFARELAGDIRYGTRVVALAQDDDGVQATVERDGARETLKADRAIVTAPFTMLREMDFQPALSEGKQRAIRDMQYESLARVLLQLRERPWEREGLAGWARTDLPSEIWHLSHGQPGSRALYGVYLKGAAADALLGMDDDARVHHAAAHVDKVFPGVAAAVEGGHAKHWLEDPWARGAHASLAPGQLVGLMPHAHTIEGRLHFAGEHTSPWQAWMEGALESGERAAREVNAA